MKIAMIVGAALHAVAVLGGIGFWLLGCSLYQPPSLAGSPAAGERVAVSGRPEVAELSGSRRVGGDLAAASEFVKGEFRSGGCRITTPLPEGYPAPTPPGAIELKRYPLVRRAEIGGTMTPDWGMNFAFFPLFNHIKRREIAMTAPVEMNYQGLEAAGAEKPSSWTMSFVYRTPEQGAAGVDPKDERVRIEDVPPMTVVAVGMRGPYKMGRMNKGITQLRDWLAQQSDWEAAGEPRTLFYNGPEASSRDLWSEVQIPVRQVGSAPAGGAGKSNGLTNGRSL